MASSKQNNEFASEVFSSQYLLDQSIEWIQRNMDPDDIFDEKALATWAENNGYEKV